MQTTLLNGNGRSRHALVVIASLFLIGGAVGCGKGVETSKQHDDVCPPAGYTDCVDPPEIPECPDGTPYHDASQFNIDNGVHACGGDNDTCDDKDLEYASAEDEYQKALCELSKAQAELAQDQMDCQSDTQECVDDADAANKDLDENSTCADQQALEVAQGKQDCDCGHADDSCGKLAANGGFDEEAVTDAQFNVNCDYDKLAYALCERTNCVDEPECNNSPDGTFQPADCCVTYANGACTDSSGTFQGDAECDPSAQSDSSGS